MQTVQAGRAHEAGSDHADSIRVWIEDARGSIARGVVEVISDDRGFVRLSETAELEAGDEVAVRLSFAPGSPSLAATARVLWLRREGGDWEAELAWTHEGVERDRLSSLVAALG